MIELFARSKRMREAISLAERVSTTDSNVFITGESGAGKDALAAFIHAQSTRAQKPYVKIDCATLPVSCWKPSCLVLNLASRHQSQEPVREDREIQTEWLIGCGRNSGDEISDYLDW